ncbi:SRPBCC domain-containing protein [Streptomyces sp. AP-93]|uniref:SRPBCC family protein n=1 Tax=Streptomyces sp. AP-93 TaxID=2929048 RepID=UPI001FB0154C|nr:SRPBCC domain-containing protein [Streptomyces sp. AP-93]MCJ0872603.1 SRPBCC domain-containing protein [Streptomyces sp. AP-93]
MTEQKPFQVETAIHAPLESVWQALTDPDRIRDWFGWDYDGLDREIRLIFVNSANYLPGHRIALGDPGDGQEIQLEFDGARTFVRATRPGDLAVARWDDTYDGIEEGWRTFFEQLRFRLERYPEQRRRTIHLTGTAVPAAVRESLQPASAEIWHSSRHQHMFIDAQGHLVGIGTEKPLDCAGPAPASVTLSVFGMDDAAFAGLRTQWAARWEALADDAEVTVGVLSR